MQGIPQRPHNPLTPSPPIPDLLRHECTLTPLPAPSLQTPVHHNNPLHHSPMQHAGSTGNHSTMDVDGEEHHTSHKNLQAMPVGPGPSLATLPSKDVGR